MYDEDTFGLPIMAEWSKNERQKAINTTEISAPRGRAS